MSEIAKNAIEHAMKMALAKVEDQKREIVEFAAALESDGGFAEYVGRAPCVRASVYGDGVPLDCDIFTTRAPRSYWRKDPRRPVIMKGAKYRLIEKFAHSGQTGANGWCTCVIKRFLRIKKYTCFDGQKHRENMLPLARWAAKWPISGAFRDDIRSIYCEADSEYASCWYQGEYRLLKRAEFDHLRALHEGRPPKPVRPPKPARIAAAAPQPRRTPPPPQPRISTQRTQERAILRAVYELGLIKPGETL